MPVRLSIIFLIPLFCRAELTRQQRTDTLESFEIVWKTVRDRHPDPTLNGLDWKAVHDSFKPRVAAAQSLDDVRVALREMLAKLGTSHYAIIPAELYKPTREPDAVAATAAPAPVSASPANSQPIAAAAEAPATAEVSSGAAPASVKRAAGASAGSASEGKLVTFGNFPEQRVTFDSRALPSGAGYIRFNEFLDPVSIMPQFEAAVKRFAKSPGIVLDLRGNPGGIAIMAMGIAGFFVEGSGHKLGEMKLREATMNFVIYPRAEIYPGKLAILVDSGSASTTEILAQGLQDLGRARIFGTRTAGAALPSDIVRLPDGDGFQFAQASYTSEKGKILEGNGVTPDVEARQTRETLLAGHDLVIEAADAWITAVP